MRKNKHSRRGYALLMCLMVVAVTSSIVLTLFTSVRLQTAESHARRTIVIRNSLADAAFEHAIAILIDDSKFKGKLEFAVPNDKTRSYVLAIQPVSGDFQVSADLSVGGVNTQITRLITSKDLDKRRKMLKLKKKSQK